MTQSLPQIGRLEDFTRSRIIHGDCRGIVGNARPRLLLTDPPYNIGFGRYDEHDDRMSPAAYTALLASLRGRADVVAVIQYPEETMRYVVPALGVPDEVIAWCYPANIARRFRLVSIYGGKPDYRKVRQPYKNPKDKRVAKLIAGGSVGGPIYDWWSDINLVKNVSREKGIHPCPIPEKLADRLIRVLTEPEDIVLDPFAGGGTVPVAAFKAGRVGVGVEKSARYAAEASTRLSKAFSEQRRSLL